MNTFRMLGRLTSVLLVTAAMSLGCGSKHNPVDPGSQAAVKTIAVREKTVAAGIPLNHIAGDGNYAGHGVLEGMAFITVGETSVTLHYFVRARENQPDWTDARVPAASGAWADVVLYSCPPGDRIRDVVVSMDMAVFPATACPSRVVNELYSEAGPVSILRCTVETGDGNDLGANGSHIVGLLVRPFTVTIESAGANMN